MAKNTGDKQRSPQSQPLPFTRCDKAENFLIHSELTEANKALERSEIDHLNKFHALSSNKLCIGFNFKHEYAKMSHGGKREKFWKRRLQAATSAAFAVSVGEKFIIKKKRGDPVLKVTDDGRGQLGHIQRDLVPVLACFPVLIVNLSILNH